MRTFEYRGLDSSGKRVKGLIEGLDPKNARETLRARGILVSELAGLDDASVPLRRGLSLSDRALIYHELGALLSAGLPMERCLQLLVDAPELAAHVRRLAGFRDAVRDGAPVHEAVSRLDPSVGDFERAILQSGDVSGQLPESLGQIARYLEEEQSLRENVVSALIYPMIVVMLSLIAVVIISLVLFPQFQDMLEQFEIEEPLLTRLVMGTGRVMAYLAPLLLLMGLVFWRYQKTVAYQKGRGPIWMRRILRRIPGIRDAYGALVNLRFCRSFEVLSRGGVSLVDAFILAGRSTGDVGVAEAVAHEAERIRHGLSPAEAVQRVPYLQDALPGWIRAGEATGNLADLLGTAGERFKQKWSRTVARLLSLLEPAVILLVGVFVLLIALAILLPMLAINKGIL